MIEHIYMDEPIPREERETSIIFNAKDPKAHIYTFSTPMIKRIMEHEEDVEKIIHYPNNVIEVVASVDKKRIRVGKWHDPTVKSNRGAHLKKDTEDTEAEDNLDDEEEEIEEEE